MILAEAWFYFDLAGMRWGALIVPPDHPKLADDEEHVRAATYPEECAMYFSSDLSDEALWFYFVHELGHAIEDVSGASYEYGRKCKTAEEHDKLEERIIRARTPVLCAFLRSFDFELPRPPERLRAMEDETTKNEAER